MEKLTDINFWASVVTILSIFFALYVFWNDKKDKRNTEKQSYLNKLKSLNFEINKNNDVILGFFKEKNQEWNNGNVDAYYRFSTSVINKIIAEGVIKDYVLLRNLDAIADNQNQVNRILDLISLMANTSQISSQEDVEMFATRIKGSSKKVIELNAHLELYLPKIIKDLDKHIKENSD